MSNNVIDRVHKLIEPLFAEGNVLSNLELVDVEYKKEGNNWYLRIFIDKEEGVTLDDCQFASKHFDNILDEQDPVPTSYFLEVSSPGVERPLKRKEDYEKFAGELVRIKTYAPFAGKKEHIGYLNGLVDDQIALKIDDSEVLIPLDKVASANLSLEN